MDKKKQNVRCKILISTLLSMKNVFCSIDILRFVCCFQMKLVDFKSKAYGLFGRKQVLCKYQAHNYELRGLNNCLFCSVFTPGKSRLNVTFVVVHSDSRVI
jgi:hypothetical protein